MAALVLEDAQYNEIVRSLSIPCPGLYCGRTLLSDGNWSTCGACPRGHRPNASSACSPCTDQPSFYDWLYLGFMALMPLVLHWFCIDVAAKRRSFTFGVIVLHLSAAVETTAAAVVTVLLAHPRWTFVVNSCRVQQLSDWYTMLHNPNPNYEHTLHCTQEAVYPLYTIVLVYYSFCLGFLLLFRPFLARKCLPTRGKASVYAAMYFLPVLAVLHATCAGLLYYSFPYITIIVSVISNAAHFAFKLDQSMKSLVLTTITDLRNLVILLGHWSLHAYGIVAITGLRSIPFHLGLLALVPLPAAFYILTARFTDPNKFRSE